MPPHWQNIWKEHLREKHITSTYDTQSNKEQNMELTPETQANLQVILAQCVEDLDYLFEEHQDMIRDHLQQTCEDDDEIDEKLNEDDVFRDAVASWNKLQSIVQMLCQMKETVPAE
jgi:hypothetical protein